MTDASNEIIIDSKDIEVIIDKDVSLIDNNIDVKTLEPEYEITINRKEYNVVGDELYIPKRYEDAPQWLRDIIDNVTDVALAAKISEINNLTQSLNNLIVELEVAKNTYTMSVISSNDINERINTAVETLNSSMLESDATILGLATTKVTPEQAQAISIDAIRTSLNDTISGNSLGSIISGMQSTTTTGDYTNAQSIEVLQSTIEGNADATATAIDTINTFAGIDSTGAYTYTGLTGYLVDPNTGMIGGGQSELQNTITTTGDNVEAKFEYGSNIKIGGQYHNAGFGLKTTMTGGDGTIADPYNSEFWINAEKFKFTNNAVSGQVSPFTIDATGATPEITFNGIVDFSNISNSELGNINNILSSNIIKNSEMKIEAIDTGIQWLRSDLWHGRKTGLDPYTAGVTRNKIGEYSPYTLLNGATAWIHQDGSEPEFSADLVFDNDGGQFTYLGHMVSQLEWYQVSGYIGSINCTAKIVVVFSDGVGQIVNQVVGEALTGKPGGSYLEDFHNYYINVQVPEGAKYATIMFRKYGTTSGSDSLMFVSKPQFINTVGSATRRIPYSENGNASGLSGMAYADMRNVTTIDGSKITTGTIDALQIASDAIAGKTITGGTINGAIINGVQINGAIIKGSFIDLTSTITLTNWQFYTPATIPPAYAANFAHNNDGTLTVDSSGFVRLPGQTNFIVGQVVSSGSYSGSQVVHINKTYDLYSWNSYKINTLQRSIRTDTVFSSTSVLEFTTSGLGVASSKYYGQSIDFNFLDKAIHVNIGAFGSNAHNSASSSITFNGGTVASAVGSLGADLTQPWDSGWLDFNTTIRGVPIRITTTIELADPEVLAVDYGCYVTFSFKATLSGNIPIIGHSTDDIIRVNYVDFSGNTYYPPTMSYNLNFQSAWVQ